MLVGCLFDIDYVGLEIVIGACGCRVVVLFIG